MLAIGAGGLEVAMAMAGEPFFVKMPKICGVKLLGELPDWVSAKDVILEMLRRHNVDGGVGTVFEYYGPGLKTLTAMDRHVVANMGAEMGATTTVFPSDQAVRAFLKGQGREQSWQELIADDGADYDEHEEINLSTLEPLIAQPTSPGNVVPVREVAGRDIYQSYIGSSANPGLRDFAVAAAIVDGKKTHDRVSFDVNPTSRQILQNMIRLGILGQLVAAGARVHQAGCGGCIGMGQAPATHRISLRTVPRNFAGRSGTREDQVYLCSPETAAASALTGLITDPRTLGIEYVRFREPDELSLNTDMISPPGPGDVPCPLELGPNIKALPDLSPLPDSLDGPVLLKVADNVSTDEIMPAGAKALPFRSNIPELSRFAFSQIDETYYRRATENRQNTSFVVAGANYGQGSSREHAALAPRHLGLRAVVAKSFARIHRQNLANFGILPLTFVHPEDWEKVAQGDRLSIPNVRKLISEGAAVRVTNVTRKISLEAGHSLTPRQLEMVLAGSLINMVRRRNKSGDERQSEAPGTQKRAI